jgi:hypothetical protein
MKWMEGVRNSRVDLTNRLEGSWSKMNPRSSGSCEPDCGSGVMRGSDKVRSSADAVRNPWSDRSVAHVHTSDCTLDIAQRSRRWAAAVPDAMNEVQKNREDDWGRTR